MLNHIQINQCVHKQNPFLIIAFLWKVDLIIVEISKTRPETSIYSISNSAQQLFFLIQNIIHNLISASEGPREQSWKVTLSLSYEKSQLITRVFDCENVFTKTVLLSNFTDKHFAQGCYYHLLRYETGK